jgi:hypothetical protein
MACVITQRGMEPDGGAMPPGTIEVYRDIARITAIVDGRSYPLIH